MKVYFAGSMRQVLLIFVIAFVLNLLWENAHSYLYVHYRGGAITWLVLLHATLFDAVITTAAAFLFFYVRPFRARAWLVVLALVLFAILLELFALSTGRWAYNELMPKVPFLGVGLTPTVQLAFLWRLSLLFAKSRVASSVSLH